MQQVWIHNKWEVWNFVTKMCDLCVNKLQAINVVGLRHKHLWFNNKHKWVFNRPTKEEARSAYKWFMEKKQKYL